MNVLRQGSLKVTEKLEQASKTDVGFSEALDLNNACVRLAKLLDAMDLDLFAATFVDRKGERPSVRPYRNQPKIPVEFSLALQDKGGCPLLREAKRLSRPFNAKQILIADEEEFLGKRYLNELFRLEHEQILVVPIIFGRGMAVFSVGTRDRSLSEQEVELLYLTISRVVTELVFRFPELTGLFEPKKLSMLEAECLFLLSNGSDAREISTVIGFSEVTINAILNTIVQKLEANNLYHALSKAQRMGEIHQFEIGPHDLI